MTAWLQITSGQGPVECCWVVAKVLDRICHEASNQACQAHLLEAVEADEPGTLKSALVALEGEAEQELVTKWEGTIQWIGRSPFRPHHKRKNWFVGVAVFRPPGTHDINPNEIKMDIMRSSGPGGQHVNKTSSAVRVTHIPTGLVAVAQEERSQHLNRRLALSRLLDKVRQIDAEANKHVQRDRWSRHAELERGNPVQVYEGNEFRLKRS